MKGQQNQGRSGRFRLGILPVLIWVLALGATTALFWERAAGYEWVGIAGGQVYQLAAPITGRLKTVAVQLFDPVSRGQVVATLDDAVLMAQMETFRSEIRRLQAELKTLQDDLSLQGQDLTIRWMESYRRCTVDVEQIRVHMLEVKTQLATDRVLRDDAELEVNVLKGLVAKEAVEPYELQKAEALYHRYAASIEQNEALLAELEDHLVEARARKEQFVQTQPQVPPADHQIDLIQEAITVQEGYIAELMAQQEALILRSPSDGVVVQIQGKANDVALRRAGEGTVRRPGEVVAEGEPLLTIASREPSEVIAYVREQDAHHVKAGMAVELRKRTPPRQVAQSQVTSVGPVVEQLPPRLWPGRDLPQWGRPVMIKVPPQMDLLPGEQVVVRGL